MKLAIIQFLFPKIEQHLDWWAGLRNIFTRIAPRINSKNCKWQKHMFLLNIIRSDIPRYIYIYNIQCKIITYVPIKDYAPVNSGMKSERYSVSSTLFFFLSSFLFMLLFLFSGCCCCCCFFFWCVCLFSHVMYIHTLSSHVMYIHTLSILLPDILAIDHRVIWFNLQGHQTITTNSWPVKQCIIVLKKTNQARPR